MPQMTMGTEQWESIQQGLSEVQKAFEALLDEQPKQYAKAAALLARKRHEEGWRLYDSKQDGGDRDAFLVAVKSVGLAPVEERPPLYPPRDGKMLVRESDAKMMVQQAADHRGHEHIDSVNTFAGNHGCIVGYAMWLTLGRGWRAEYSNGLFGSANRYRHTYREEDAMRFTPEAEAVLRAALHMNDNGATWGAIATTVAAMQFGEARAA